MELSPFKAALPSHCTPTSPFLTEVSRYFQTCVPTPLALISTLLGALSIISWLFAQMPQIYKNYQLQSTAGLSIYFLAEWLAGDATNLAGAVLTHQASWQVVVASYYVFVDICLVVQFFWYTRIKPWKEGGVLHSSGSSFMSDGSDVINRLSPINTQFAEELMEPEEEEADPPQDKAPQRLVRSAVHSQLANEKLAALSDSSGIRVQAGPGWNPYPSQQKLLCIAATCALISQTNAAPIHASGSHQSAAGRVPPNTLEIIGTILSWSSTVLYLGSRLPQLYKNWRRQSTAGLSPLLFFAAFCGNSFYSTSLLASPYAWYDFEPYGGHGWAGRDGSERSVWVASAAPFFLGAAGVLLLDALMGVQFILYGEPDEEKIVKVRDSRGHSRWERVSGWMRGYIPSVSQERKVAVMEGEALIRSSRDLRHLSGYGTIE